MMKKMSLLLLALLLAFALPGCKIQREVAAFGDVEVDAQIPPELDYANNGDIDMDGFFDDEDYDLEGYEEEDYSEIERSIAPAPAGSPVDYIIDDAKFASQMDELSVFEAEYQGKSFQMIGYILYTDEGDVQFAVARDYQIPAHDHDEDGELIEHVEFQEGEISQTGMYCLYDGEKPAENAWVRVTGTLGDYDYIDEDGEPIPMLVLNVTKIENIPQTVGGSRLVTQ